MKKPILVSAIAALVVMGGGVAYAGGNNSNAPSSVSPAVTPASSPVTAPSETSFVPVAPCRLVNTTRAGGQIKSGKNRAFLARGTSLGAQGGQAGGCGVPASATAVTVTVTAVSPTANGSLVVYPSDLPAPPTRTLTYRKKVDASAGTTTQLASSGTADFRVKVSRSTHVLVDVTGYYAPPMAAFVDMAGNLQYTTGRAIDSTHASTGNYVVTFDRDVSQCTFQVTPYAYNWVVAVGPQLGNPDQAHVYIHDQDGTIAAHDTSFFIQAVC